MPSRNLTSRFCETVKGNGKQVTFPDAEARGLELRVSGAGAKSWTFRYRNDAGQQRRLTLGAFSPDSTPSDDPEAPPLLDLRQARIAARRARAAVDAGQDPAALKAARRDKARAKAVRTFDDLAQAYFSACESGRYQPRGKRKRERTLSDERGVYRRHVEKVLGPSRLDEIRRRDVRILLDGMADRGIGAQTARAHALIRQAFAFGMDREYVEANPAQNLLSVARAGVRDRVLSDEELRLLWQGLEKPGTLKTEDGGPVRVSRPMALVVQLLMILLQRRGELVGMRRNELDLDEGVWRIPGSRMKAGHPHVVPLPPIARSLIEEATMLAEARFGDEPPQDFPIFPGHRDKRKPMRPDSVTHAMQMVARAQGIHGAAPHDLRRTGATRMTAEKLGITHFIRSRVLSHASDTGGGATVSAVHYDGNEYLNEKRKALVAWEDYLMSVCTKTAAHPSTEPADCRVTTSHT